MSTTLQIIISVLAGGLITWFFSWFFFRRQNGKFRIAHFLTDAYDIGKGLTDVFPDFELTYKRETMSKIVYVLKGGFMNVGHGDIVGLEGKDDIKMILPEGCNVRDIDIIPSDEKLIVNETHEGNLIKFGIEKFFATDEFFNYVAIVESDKEIESWVEKGVLKFNNRILKTKKEITNCRIYLADNTKKLMFSYKTMCLTIFCAIILGYDASLWFQEPSRQDFVFWMLGSTPIFLLGCVTIDFFSPKDERHIKKVLLKSMKNKK